MRTGMAPREQEDMSQSILIETVRVVRDFLNEELRKYETWEEFRSVEITRTKYYGNIQKEDFARLKNSSVGHGIILSFLGGGWKEWKVKSALDTLNAEDINMDAMFEFMLYKLKLNEPQTAHNELNKPCIED